MVSSRPSVDFSGRHLCMSGRRYYYQDMSTTTNLLPRSFDLLQNTETKADLWGLDLLASKSK